MLRRPRQPWTRLARTAAAMLACALAGGCSLATDLDTTAVEALRCASDADCPGGSRCTSHGYCGQLAPDGDATDAGDATDSGDTGDTTRPDEDTDLGDATDDDDTAGDDTADTADTDDTDDGDDGDDGDATCAGAVCDGICIDTLTSDAHCGACDSACAQPLLCIQGACGCEPPLTDCARLCVDILHDEANCGSCGIACGDGATCIEGTCRCGDASGELCEAAGDAVASASCSARDCTLVCTLARSDCNGESSDGCEGDLLCP